MPPALDQHMINDTISRLGLPWNLQGLLDTAAAEDGAPSPGWPLRLENLSALQLLALAEALCLPVEALLTHIDRPWPSYSGFNLVGYLLEFGSVSDDTACKILSVAHSDLDDLVKDAQFACRRGGIRVFREAGRIRLQAPHTHRNVKAMHARRSPNAPLTADEARMAVVAARARTRPGMPAPAVPAAARAELAAKGAVLAHEDEGPMAPLIAHPDLLYALGMASAPGRPS